mgnify:CR=1 FL=1
MKIKYLHTMVRVKNIEESKEFYCDLLGLKEIKRKEYFGNTKAKPHTKFSSIKTLNGIPYAEGEIYYCNWPHIISRQGNQKMFLDTKWAHPYEQTWMSHIYTLTKEKAINSAILLASPITHNRTEHYDKSERKEN